MQLLVDVGRQQLITLGSSVQYQHRMTMWDSVAVNDHAQCPLQPRYIMGCQQLPQFPSGVYLTRVL